MEKLTIVAFWLALACSVVSSLAYTGNFFSRAERKVHIYASLGGALGAFMLLLATIFIRAQAIGISQTAGPFTMRIIYSAFIIGLFLLVEAVYAGKNPKVRAFGMFVMPVALLLQFLAWHSYKLTLPLTEQLNSYWVAMHATFAVLAYSSMTIALAVAIAYLLQEKQLKNMRKKKPGKVFRKLPSLETSDVLCHRAISFSFAFLTLVISTGIIKAEMLPDWTMWYSDPKILMAIATWVVYGAYLLVWSTLGWRGKRANAFVILGFAIAVFTYFIGNSSFITDIIPSLHRYGGGFG